MVIDNALCEEIDKIAATGCQLLFKFKRTFFFFFHFTVRLLDCWINNH